MARPRTIDRDSVLDSAERLVQRRGASALTLDAVAREAGITKGGLQYCFGSKDDLITALIDRWIAQFDAQIARHLGPDPTPRARVAAYVAACGQTDAPTHARLVGMLVTLLHSPRHLQRVRDWYAGWFHEHMPGSDAGERARTAFFAAEGAFFLRSLGFVEMDEAQWQNIFASFQRLAM
ncbi:TetR/AcrR family transcriptional regulator [Komagataeibacter medellinensis]|uniref:TetR/AcrR family transcriptional regulator n=1 Tax=Komagataeibacter medellinensis TaxID=1177712 RepID=A0ABQ6VR45_9PROT|nr:TetR/AcrR family transcriptional regulator [Komagataeibacter medellinensis]KAB8122414.1 TetR/AcrR family transcriptional regulator [Komagataeibacter medellinensis]